jgi:hypothetical protein
MRRNPADEITFQVDGLPLGKNEAKSMLASGHRHAPRVAALLWSGPSRGRFVVHAMDRARRS